MNSSIKRYHLFSCSTVLNLGSRKFLQEYGTNDEQYHVFWQIVLRLPKKKKAMNSNEEKRVRESNCLLFNSQTILPHIAKWKKFIKMYYYWTNLMNTIRPQWNWFEKKKTRKNTSNLQKQPIIWNLRTEWSNEYCYNPIATRKKIITRERNK